MYRTSFSFLFFLRGLSLFCVLFFVPSFAIAQTTAGTSTPAVPEKSELQKYLDAQIQSRLNQLPNPAQIRSSAIRNYLEVKTSPAHPKPGETVRISIESALADLSKAVISWSVNGSLLKKGIGEKSFSFKNGGSGSTTRVTILMLTNGGEAVTKELTFKPMGVTVLWEADTYTPPFYKGKPLMTPQAQVRAIAIPDTGNAKNPLSAGNLVYVWTKNGTTASESSGYAKNSFTFTGPKPHDETNVRLQVSSLENSTINSEVVVRVPLSTPLILFYEKHPLEGVRYDKPITAKQSLLNNEITLRAEPYFFSNESGENTSISYQWLLNGKGVQNQGRTINLKNDKGLTGNSSIQLTVRNKNKTFQTGSRSTTLRFGDVGNEKTRKPFF